MPPFDGPRAMLWVTRYPWKTRVEPSSIATGMETASAFLHSWRTLMRFGSIAKVLPTLCSWAFAISYGFSRRCETGASTVVTCDSFLLANRVFFPSRLALSLLDSERDRPHSGAPVVRRIGGQAQGVIAG